MKSLACFFVLALAWIPSAYSNDSQFGIKPLQVNDFRELAAAALHHLSSTRSSKVAWEAVRSYDHRRLAQVGEDFCSWDAGSGECALSATGIIEVMESVDNTVADHVARTLTCELSGSEAECEASDCEWFGVSGGCRITHEEFREFHSVECLSAVDHIIEARAGDRECRPKETELECGAASRCTWSRQSCSWDAWYYYYGILSVAGVPEGFGDVFTQRQTQFLDDLQVAIEIGVLETYGDMFAWDPPSFTCPTDTEQVVCEYVEAFVPYIKKDFYCNNAYESDATGCALDSNCEYVPSEDGPSCVVRSDEVDLIVDAANIAFAEGIEDPTARDYEVLFYTCQAILTVDSCDAEPNCVWLEAFGGCFVTDKWIAEDIASLVDETEGPVCEYFTLDVGLGCTDLTDAAACDASTSCTYNQARESCGVSNAGEIVYGVAVSGELDTLTDSIDSCEAAETASSCALVDGLSYGLETI